MEELSELVRKFCFAARKCFEDFENYVKNDRASGSGTHHHSGATNVTVTVTAMATNFNKGQQPSIPPDATVHEVTSNTCLFLKRLYEFKDTLQRLWLGTPSPGTVSINNNDAPVGKPKQTVLGDLTCMYFLPFLVMSSS
jgi:hypothetical protein